MNPIRSRSPAADRNREPILAVLQRLLPAQATVLEIASGTGQHAAHCAGAMPAWRWQPTDGDAAALPDIDAWCAGLSNVQPALALDVLRSPWPVAGPFDAVFCANMLHISPWSTCAALMQGAAALLAATGLLVTYGPYLQDGVVTSPGNLAFDADLRRRHADWGLRRVEDVESQAERAGLRLEETVAMPANNLMLVFARAG